MDKMNPANISPSRVTALYNERDRLRAENEQLRVELIESEQRNDIFCKCTARALTLWQQRHPDSRMWPDTAENICWLAEENERLRGLLRLVVKEYEPFLYNEIACFVSAPDFEKIQDELGDE